MTRRRIDEWMIDRGENLSFRNLNRIPNGCVKEAFLLDCYRLFLTVLHEPAGDVHTRSGHDGEVFIYSHSIDHIEGGIHYWINGRVRPRTESLYLF